jgi:hypothetical protein
MEPWTTPTDTGHQGETKETPIIDFSQLRLEKPPPNSGNNQLVSPSGIYLSEHGSRAMGVSTL